MDIPSSWKKLGTAAKFVIGAGSSALWLLLPNSASPNIFIADPDSPGIRPLFALFVVVGPLFLGIASALLDFISGSTGRIARFFGAWLPCTLYYLTVFPLFVFTRYGLVSLAVSTIANVAASAWLRRRYPNWRQTKDDNTRNA